MRWIALACLLLSVTLPAAAQAVFFQDDFENGDTGWDISTGAFEVADGKLIWDYEGENMASFNHSDFTPMTEDFEISFDLKLTSANGAWRIGTGYNITDDDSTWLATNFYNTGVFYLFNGEETFFERERPAFDFLDDQFHRVRIVNARNVLQLWVDDELLYAIEHDQPMNGSAFVMIGAHNNRGVNTMRAEIDNYVVQPYIPQTYTLPEDGIQYDQLLALTLEPNTTLRLPFVVHEQDVVDFVYLHEEIFSYPVYSVYMPDGGLWVRESKDLLNTILPVSGIWHLEIKNDEDNPDEIEMMVRLVSTSAESITSGDSLTSLTPADMSGRYLAPLLKRIYISPNTNLALLHQSNFLIGERADGTIILSEDQATLDAALANPGFINDPEYPLRYIWVHEDAGSSTSEVPQHIFEENFSQFAGTQLGESEQTAFTALDWYFWRFGGDPADYSSFDRRTFAIRLDDNRFAVGYEVDGSRAERSEFDTIDIVESLALAFPYMNDEQRAALGLPLNQVDAPTLEVDVELPQTHSTDGFTFDYPAGEWRVSDSTTSDAIAASAISGIVGLPAILVYEPTSGTSAEVAFFVPTPGTFFSASTWMDIMNLASAQMFNVSVEYSLEQVYVGENLMTIVETDSQVSGRMRRFEVRLSNAETVTMLVAGDALDLIDRDTLLAIAGSLRP